MRTISAAIVLFAVLAGAAFGQYFTPGTAQGSLTASASSCSSSGASCVIFPVNAETASVAWALSGTFSATITWEASLDGTNWFAYSVLAPGANAATSRAYASTSTTTGIWQMNVAGLQAVRARCSAFTSGTVSVYVRRSTGEPAP